MLRVYSTWASTALALAVSAPASSPTGSARGVGAAGPAIEAQAGPTADGAAQTGRAPQPTKPATTAKPAGERDAPLQADVTAAGGPPLVYAESEGEDLGDFAGPGFTQRCVRVSRPSSALTVFFRPDRGSGRVEVVFELGRLWGEANAKAATLGPYHVRIARGDHVVLAEIEVPKHWWFARWRWQSAPRPVIRNAADLQAGRLVPLPFDPDLVRFCGKSQPVRYAGPMDPAGIYQAMGTTGDRADIGPMTEWQAEYLATGDPRARDSLLAQAGKAGGIPWHRRDERTAAPLDVYQHPNAFFGDFPAPDPQHQRVLCTATDWAVDDAHQPALAYVPYLLTGDPYFLEALQDQGVWSISWEYYHRDSQKLPVANPGQTRKPFAWTACAPGRSQSKRVTPTDPLGWLLGRSHWKKILDDNLAYFQREWVRGPKPEQTVFRSATRPDIPQAFQEDYLALVLGCVVELGFEEWREAFAWKVGSTIARSDGLHGWPAQWSSPYMYSVRAKDGAPFASWAEAWEAFRADPVNKVPDKLPPWPRTAQDNSGGYTYYTLAALGGDRQAAGR